MAVGDIYRVAFLSDYGGNDLVNVFHYVVTVSIGPAEGEPGSLAAALAGAPATAYVQSMVSDAQLQLISVRGVTNPTLGFDESMALAGVASPPVLPLQNAVLAIKDTALFGRSFKGKNYFPAISELAVENGAVGVGTIGQIEAFFSAADQVGDLQYFFKMAVYSKLLNVATPTTGVRVGPYVRIQRRRTPGVGS